VLQIDFRAPALAAGAHQIQLHVGDRKSPPARCRGSSEMAPLSPRRIRLVNLSTMPASSHWPSAGSCRFMQDSFMTARQHPKALLLVLIKPSHYDDDGYVIQWVRSAMPSIPWRC